MTVMENTLPPTNQQDQLIIVFQQLSIYSISQQIISPTEFAVLIQIMLIFVESTMK